MKTDEHQPSMSANELLSELNNLGRMVNESNDGTAVKALQSFINLYINNERQSEQYFLALCEYNILPKLFVLYTRHTSTLETLQTLNLLVANCGKMSQLVFIFSQASLHQFLFQRFVIEKENGQTVEYYVQLLKTMIMKMSSVGNTSLIKLFCNSRFPHFPLLTVITMLGVEFNQEVLVRVTANQCFLLLIKLLNQTKVGVEYLSEVQTIIYYHELTAVFFREGEEEQREMIRFFVDLILELRKNVVSLSIFMNLLTNTLFFTNIDRPAQILRFATGFYAEMQGHSDFPSELAQDTINVLLNIFMKYYMGVTINYTFFTAQKILVDFLVPQKPSLLKFYEKRCKKIQEYLILQMPLFEEEKELQFVWQQWQHFCYKNQQISPLKEYRRKSRNRFTQFFTSDEDLVEEYVKAVMTKAGLSCEKINKPLYKLSYSTEYQTALYLVEYVNLKFGSESEKQKLKYQYFYKDSVWQLRVNEEFLCEIYKICKLKRKQMEQKLQKMQKKASQQSVQISKSCFRSFLQNIRGYLAKSFVAVMGSHESQLQAGELCLISAISSRLGLLSCIEIEGINLLMNKLRELQVYITEDIFSEQNFHFVLKYICRGKEKVMLKKIDRIKECDSPTSPKKKFYKTRTRIQRNFVLYEVIKRLIDSSVKSLSDFVEEYWRSRFFAEKDGIQYPITLFLYKFSNGGTLEVIADADYQFIAKKANKDFESVTYSICKDDCSFDRQNPTYLSFEDHKFFIDLETEEKAENFRQDLSRLRKQKSELIMNGILQYLSFSYESLAIVCNLKFSRIKGVQTPR